jgi:hypothetical protein
MSDLQAWDSSVEAWREMRRRRPLGIAYRYPAVALPEHLTIRPKVGGLCGDYPAAFWTLDRVASGS